LVLWVEWALLVDLFLDHLLWPERKWLKERGKEAREAINKQKVPCVCQVENKIVHNFGKNRK
jgi:hypothetical protein